MIAKVRIRFRAVIRRIENVINEKCSMKKCIYLFFLMLLFNSFDLLQLCLAGHCYDNKKNDDETGIDCGGSCRPCKGLV